MKSIKNILTLLFISFLSFSTFAGNGSEIIVIGNTGPDYYLVDYNTDWIASMNRQQYEQWLASERQRQSAYMAQQLKEQRIKSCTLEVNDIEKTCIFKANEAYRHNIDECGLLSDGGVSITLQIRGVAGLSFSSGSQYTHCINMSNAYLSSEKSGCSAAAAAGRKACSRDN